jgi:cation:H+ antiporter
MDIVLPLTKALIALAIILAGCELFTNAIEWFGSKLNLSAGVVGSILAAVGTALPETLVPLVAILLIGGDAAKDIGIGAILGAPFMLATLAFFVTGAAVIVFRRRRVAGTHMSVHTDTLGQDLAYFVAVYLLAVGISPVLALLPSGSAQLGERALRAATAVVLLVAYGVYVWRHLQRKDQEEEEELRALYLQYRCEGQPRLRFVVSQVFLGLVAIVGGAHLFVENLEHVALGIGVPPLVLSLIVTPIATELPEKFNSILWVRQGKDTLAIGNISGAMVFQSCIPGAIGITMTEWALDTSALASAAAALVSSAIVFAYLRTRGALNGWILLLGLPLYIAFLVVAFRAR